MAYDAVRLVDSAVTTLNGDISDTDAFAAAIHEANFDSVRGKFSFNTNNHPLQDMYLAKVVKDENGDFVSVSEGIIAESMVDSYVDQCDMK